MTWNQFFGLGLGGSDFSTFPGEYRGLGLPFISGSDFDGVLDYWESDGGIILLVGKHCKPDYHGSERFREFYLRPSLTGPPFLARKNSIVFVIEAGKFASFGMVTVDDILARLS